MDIVGSITSANLFDILFVLLLIAAFVLGFIQGTIRRLLGIASILFSFLLAANLRDLFGSFLASNWTQFSAEYAYMLAFLIVFVVASIAFSLIIQGFYKRQELFANATIVDEVLGGILGVVQALLIVGCLMVILDSFFLLPGVVANPNEVPFLRDFFKAYDPSTITQLYRDTLIPVFYALFGWIIPSSITQLYPTSG